MIAAGALALSSTVWVLLFGACWCWYRPTPATTPATPDREPGRYLAENRARRPASPPPRPRELRPRPSHNVYAVLRDVVEFPDPPPVYDLFERISPDLEAGGGAAA